MKKETNEMRSYYCYPNINTLNFLPAFINSVEEDKLRKILGLISCCGYRIGEAMNSFVYKNEDRLIIQAPMEKKKKFTGHTMLFRGFLGEATLKFELKNNPKLWKMNELKFPFKDIDVSWLWDNLSQNQEHPEFLFNGKWSSYKTFYASLHKYPPFELKYRKNKYQLYTTTEYTPSFHFFRKCFCAEAIRKHTFKNIVELTQYIGWEKLDMAMFYVQDYGEGDEQRAIKTFDSNKFHYED